MSGEVLIVCSDGEKKLTVEEFDALKRQSGLLRLMVEDDERDEDGQSLEVPLPPIKLQLFVACLEFILKDYPPEWHESIPATPSQFSGVLASVPFLARDEFLKRFADRFAPELFNLNAKLSESGGILAYVTVADYLQCDNLGKFLAFLLALAIRMRVPEQVVAWAKPGDSFLSTNLTEEQEREMQEMLRAILKLPPLPHVQATKLPQTATVVVLPPGAPVPQQLPEAPVPMQEPFAEDED